MPDNITKEDKNISIITYRNITDLQDLQGEFEKVEPLQNPYACYFYHMFSSFEHKLEYADWRIKYNDDLTFDEEINPRSQNLTFAYQLISRKNRISVKSSKFFVETIQSIIKPEARSRYQNYYKLKDLAQDSIYVFPILDNSFFLCSTDYEQYIMSLVNTVKEDFSDYNVKVNLYLHNGDNWKTDAFAKRDDFAGKIGGKSNDITIDNCYSFSHALDNKFYIKIFKENIIHEESVLLSYSDISKKCDEILNPPMSSEQGKVIDEIMVELIGDTFFNDYVGFDDFLSKFKDFQPMITEGKNPLSKYKEAKERRHMFLDSSIWFRYMTDNDDLISLIEKYKEKGLYKTTNAKELREFNCRLAQNSYIKAPKNENDTSEEGHGQYIAPFTFHSETKMRELAQQKCDELNKYGDIDSYLEWRFLIVDDNALVKKEKEERISKIQIVCDALNDKYASEDKCQGLFEFVCEDVGEEKGLMQEYNILEEYVKNEGKPYDKQIKGKIYLDYAKNKEEAIAKIKSKRYDIILLDYLLGWCAESDTERIYVHKDVPIEEMTKIDGYITKREYSYELLSELEKWKDTEDEKNIGPFNKLWFFPITAFTNAFSNRLLEKGFHYSDNCWKISRGACPTTTPELFRYNLLSLMLQQIQETTEIVQNKFGECKIVTLLDILYFIFENAKDTRSRAIKNFNPLLHLRAHYDILWRDYYMGGKGHSKAFENGSPLIQSLFPDIKHYTNAFWEHLQHLIYLVAFGNIRQWNEMWDEYIFIKENLIAADKKEEPIHEKIERYIIAIKTANYK